MQVKVDKPRITWIMAVKNGMPYLGETLKSLADQTYENAEVLIWDNGSTDGSVELLLNWVPNLLPGRVVIDDPQENLATSFAKCVELCSTELIARIDADDICVPERLELQVDYMLRHPEVAVLGGNVIEIDASGDQKGMRRPLPTEPTQMLLSFIWENPLVHPTTLIRRSAVLACGNYRNVGPVNVEDYDLWMRIAARFPVANLDRVLLHYRSHPNSTTMLAARAKTLDAATEKCLFENSQLLYGCSGEEILQIRHRKLRSTLRTFRRIANYLELKNPEIQDLFFEPDFQAALFRAGQRILGRGRDRSFKNIVDWAKKLRRSAETAARARKSSLKRARQLTQWINWAVRRNGVTVGPGFNVRGGVSAFLQLNIGRGTDFGAQTLIDFSSAGSSGALKVGRFSRFDEQLELWVGEPIVIGTRVVIGRNCRISARKADCWRSEDSSSTTAMACGVIIGDDVRIGSCVFVTAGVIIGSGSEVLSGSVVTDSVPRDQVWGGAPASLVRRK